MNLDLIIGGMPRGGTSAIADLFNCSDNAYCYYGETHWVPLMMEFALHGPAPSTSLKQMSEILLHENKHVLIEMMRYAIKLGSADEKILIFDDADIPVISEQIMAFVASGLYGAELLKAVLGVMRQHLSDKTGKQFIGEKTPSNVFGFAKFGTVGADRALMIIREPFSVIRSMRKRTEQSEDIYANPFRENIWPLIGHWIEYADAMLTADNFSNTKVVRYEDHLSGDIENVMELVNWSGLQDKTGPLSRIEQEKMARHFKQTVPAQVSFENLGFFSKEAALVWYLTHAFRKDFDYQGDFFSSRLGLTPTFDTSSISLENAIIPLSGFIHTSPDPNTNDPFWLKESGFLAITAQKGFKQANCQTFFTFPERLRDEYCPIDLKFYDAYAGHSGLKDANAIGHVQLNRNDSEGPQIAIDLRQCTPVLETTDGDIFLIKYTSSLSFRPFLQPVQPDLESVRNFIPEYSTGRDRQEYSFMMHSFSFTD